VVGPNAVRSHRARALPVLARQLRSPLLLLLAVTALASTFLGQRSDAVIIGVILLASVSLGQRVPLHAVTLQNAYPFHHPAEAAFAALVDPVGVVDPGRAVDRQADQKPCSAKNAPQSPVEQGAVGLDGVGDLAGPPVQLGQFHRAAEEAKSHHRRLAARPEHRLRRRGDQSAAMRPCVSISTQPGTDRTRYTLAPASPRPVAARVRRRSAMVLLLTVRVAGTS
jgi:hypothetical protein